MYRSWFVWHTPDTRKNQAGDVKVGGIRPSPTRMLGPPSAPTCRLRDSETCSRSGCVFGARFPSSANHQGARAEISAPSMEDSAASAPLWGRRVTLFDRFVIKRLAHMRMKVDCWLNSCGWFVFLFPSVGCCQIIRCRPSIGRCNGCSPPSDKSMI
jgi:hypothetical protein